MKNCADCPPALFLPLSQLHDCTHCSATFCTVHIIEHHEKLEFHLKTVPDALGIKLRN